MEWKQLYSVKIFNLFLVCCKVHRIRSCKVKLYFVKVLALYLVPQDFFTDDDNPDRGLLAKSSSLTSTTTSESSALQRGRGFGPRYATFEVVRRVAMPSAKIAAAAERPVYLYTLAAKEKDYKADLLR